jgi:hypothetical protein
MAAKPIPLHEDSTEVEIGPDGSVTGQVEIKNSGVVKFQVDYKPGYNVCFVNITKDNISWGNSAAEGDNTIKVGNG